MAEFRELTGDVYAFLQPPLIWYSSAGVIIMSFRSIFILSLHHYIRRSSFFQDEACERLFFIVS